MQASNEGVAALESICEAILSWRPDVVEASVIINSGGNKAGELDFRAQLDRVGALCGEIRAVSHLTLWSRSRTLAPDLVYPSALVSIAIERLKDGDLSPLAATTGLERLSLFDVDGGVVVGIPFASWPHLKDLRICRALREPEDFASPSRPPGPPGAPPSPPSSPPPSSPPASYSIDDLVRDVAASCPALERLEVDEPCHAPRAPPTRRGQPPTAGRQGA